MGKIVDDDGKSYFFNMCFGASMIFVIVCRCIDCCIINAFARKLVSIQ